MVYCTTCGQKVQDGSQFCTFCGKPVGAPPHLPPPVVGAPPWQPTAAGPSVADMPPVKKRSGLPVLFIVLGVLVLAGAVCIGGVVYVGYQVKEKVTSVAQAVTHSAPSQPPASPNENKPAAAAEDNNNLGALLGNLGGMLGGDSDGDPVESMSDKDPVIPCKAGTFPPQSGARIPLQAGTTITYAWGMKNADVETRMVIDSADPSSLAMSAKSDVYKDDDGHQWKPSVSTHSVCYEDYASSNLFGTVTGTTQPHIIPGLTRLRLSDKSFQEIKSGGKTNLIYFDVLSMPEAIKPDYQAGLLTRVEPQDVSYPMIVNDQKVTLPVIHISGIMDIPGKDPRPKKDRPLHSLADVYIVDDPLDPLVVDFKLKDPALHNNKFRIEVVKIDFAVPHPVNMVEKQLAETKRAVTWGIYFDFNKDTIKPESAPVLKQIVQAMTDNPDWKLTVEGNTDNIGGDTYNLDLSKRRAAAVKETLVTQYHIAPERLSTDGYGAAHPIDTNDTLEGRARNRRVELSRE